MITSERYYELMWKFQDGTATTNELKELSAILDHEKRQVLEKIGEAEHYFDEARSRMKQLVHRPWFVFRWINFIAWKIKDRKARRRGEQLVPNNGRCAVCGEPVRHYYPDWTSNPETHEDAMPLHKPECTAIWFNWGGDS